MRKFWTLVVSGAMTVGVAFGGVATVTSPEPTAPTRVVEVEVAGITCPEEDTCLADLDYRDGRWYVKVWK